MKLHFPNLFGHVPPAASFATTQEQRAAKDAEAATLRAELKSQQELHRLTSRLADGLIWHLGLEPAQVDAVAGRPVAVSLEGGERGKTGYELLITPKAAQPFRDQIAQWAKGYGWNAEIIGPRKESGAVVVAFTARPEGPTGAKQGAKLPTPAEVGTQLEHTRAEAQKAKEKAERNEVRFFHYDQDAFWADLRSLIRRGYDSLDFDLDTTHHRPEDILTPEARAELTKQGYTWRIDTKDESFTRPFTLTVMPAKAAASPAAVDSDGPVVQWR